MVECFNIHILQKEGGDLFDISNVKCIYSKKCLESKWKINPTIILADPFLFVHNGILYLFFESKNFFSPGVLKMVHTTDLENWTEPVTVLKEKCHLSYPFVYEEGGRVYMIPETGAIGEVRIYQAEDDTLTHFTYKNTILKQPEGKIIKMGYGDSSIYKKDGVYYLMTMLQYDDAVNTLELYTSNNLFGPYVAHPCSPVTTCMKIGRNAGSWIEHKGNLYRVSQDCTRRYGDNVNVSEITRLSETDYNETLIKENILPPTMDKYNEGGHQYNTIVYRGMRIVATDAKEYHSMLVWRLADKVLRLLRVIR